MLQIEDLDERREKVMAVVREHFRPEFLNRLDDIVLFDAISEEMLREIVDVQLRDTLAYIKSEKDITIELSAAARRQLVAEGYDPAYGVRPLKRVLQQRILDPLAQAIIAGRVREQQTVTVEYADDAFTLKPVSDAADTDAA